MRAFEPFFVEMFDEEGDCGDESDCGGSEGEEGYGCGVHDVCLRVYV